MNSDPIPYRPLGLIANALEEVGLSVSYAYEDLIFVESTVVLVKMCETPEDVLLYTNETCPEEDIKDLDSRLTISARKQGLNLSYAEKFKLNQKEEKKLDVTFL
jgi:hypothetical protein